MQATKYISIAILGICGMLSNASYATDRTTDDVFSAYSASNISSTHIYSTYHTSTYHTSTYHTSTYHTSTPLSPIASTTAPQLTSTMFDTQDQSDIRGRMNANSNDPFGGGTLPNQPYPTRRSSYRRYTYGISSTASNYIHIVHHSQTTHHFFQIIPLNL